MNAARPLPEAAHAPERIELPVAEILQHRGKRERHQIAVFQDFCNDCGNCDTFCPEEGGPYLEKPRFFGTLDGWHRWRDRDGFFASPPAWAMESKPMKLENRMAEAARNDGQWKGTAGSPGTVTASRSARPTAKST